MEVEPPSPSGSSSTGSVRLGLRLPGGDSSFAVVIRENRSFVDKSLFITEVLSSEFRVNLILRPRRFGKSLNLSMLKFFFDIVGAAENRQLFTGLRIEREHPYLFHEGGTFGRHPVINLDLRQLKALSWDDMLGSVRNLLSMTYSQFKYLLESNVLDDDEKILFRRIKSCDDTVKKSQLQGSLMMLSAYLTRYHNSPCVILIDEYDAPLESAFHEGFFKEARAFFGGLFSLLLKGNDANIFKAVLVGVLRVSKADFLSGLNNLMVFSFRDNKFSDKFGFTTTEVNALLERHQTVFLNANIVTTWYNGYQSNNILLFNPWSIICLCAEGAIRNYWVDSGSTATIQALLKSRTPAFKETALILMSWNTAVVSINDTLRYDDLSHTADDSDVWTLLYYAGYLALNNDGRFFIPNMEVYSEWVAWLLPKIREKSVVNLLVESLLSGDVEEFSRELPNTVMESLSYFDVGGSTSGTKAEAFYHAFCLGLFISARDRKYEVKSNHEGGTGRYDLKIMPTTQISSSVGVIIEFKVVGESEDLQDMAFAGLNEDHDREYRADCPQQLTKLCEYGIAFKGTNCYVVGENGKKIWGVHGEHIKIIETLCT